MTALECEQVTVTKGDVDILRGIDLSVPSGSVLGVVGASGSGKSTLLRALAGLDPVAGTIRFDGIDVTAVPPAGRNVGLVFQTPVLYPKRTVGRNISFPLEMRRDTADEIRRRVGAEARAHHIDGILRASPAELSAGEAQVVAIARAMVRSPSVLLLDEPFAHLDDDRTSQVRQELSLIQRGFGVTTVIATNDSVDAMVFADDLAVIEQGRVTQIGRPLDIYDHPDTAAAALMTGDADIIEVRVTADRDGCWLVHDGFRLRAWAPAVRRHHGRPLQMVVRPEWWRVDPNGLIEARVERAQRLGRTLSLWCRVSGRPVTITMTDDDAASIAADLDERDRHGGHGADHHGDHDGHGGGLASDPANIRLRLDRYVLLDPSSGGAIG